MAKAEAAELDLVEIAPTAKPPVCRIMDYGKFKYREAKKQHEAKLKLKQIQVKEVKFRPGTDEGDYQIKLRNLIRFLGEGDKAKITLRFRGREMAHQEFGVRLLERIRNDLEPHSVVESWPRLEGRQMVMLLAPKKVVPKRITRPSPKPVSRKATKPLLPQPLRPSLTRSMPAATCFCTTSATAARTLAASAARSTGTPSSLAYIVRTRSSGRGRLPVWVVRKRSVLRFMGDLPECGDWADEPACEA